MFERSSFESSVMVTCYLSLGSNLGNRKKNIALALAALRADAAINVLKVSSVIETEPEGVPLPQPRFLNAVVKLKTSYTTRQLLEKIQQIETKLGRQAPPRPKNYPRAIDLDILLYGDSRVKEKDLEIPHPRMRERQFVLKPLEEIAGVKVMKRLSLSVILLLFFAVQQTAYCRQFPLGSWKGIVTFSLKGKVVDAETGQGIPRISAYIIVDDVIIREQTVATKDGQYHLHLVTSDLLWKPCFYDLKFTRRLGPPEETVEIHLSADGYNGRTILVPKDKIRIDKKGKGELVLNVVLEPNGNERRGYINY